MTTPNLHTQPSGDELTDNPVSWRVLIIDDEPDNLRLIADLLGFSGVKTHIAADGMSGLAVVDSDTAHTFKPNLILLDIQMPRMDGWDVHRQLRSRPALDAVPIIALTALAMRADAERVAAEGFDGYITKPFRIKNLLSEMTACVQNFMSNSPKSILATMPIPPTMPPPTLMYEPIISNAAQTKPLRPITHDKTE